MYRVSVTSGNSYTFKTGCGDGATASYDTYLELYNSGCTLVASDDDGCESNRSKITWTATYTGYAYLKVRGYGGAGGSYTLAYRIEPLGSLSGQVTNSRTTWGIENATVSITGPANQSTTTNSNGDYSFSSIPSGTYNLTVTKTGYPTFGPTSVVVSGNTTRNVSMTPYVTINSFSVSPSTTYPGGRLTITYSLANSSSSSQTVWLGASVKLNGTSNYLDDPPNDISITVPANATNYSTQRYFDTQASYQLGSYDVAVGVWRTKQGGLMVDNYDRREQTNMFTLAWSSLSGQVTNSRTTRGIENATVSITGPANQSTTTNSNGDYSFSSIPSGTYNLTVTKTGYPTFGPTSVVVSGNTTRNVSMTPYVTINSFSVSPSTTYPGGRLTITYSLANSSSSSQTVWLGASVKLNGTSNYLDDPPNDISITVPANATNYSTQRYFDTQASYQLGSYDVAVGVWRTKQGGLMVDNYDRREQINMFTLLNSVPRVNIIGLLQRAHEDPTVIDSNSVGIRILAWISDSLSFITEAKVRYVNLSNLIQPEDEQLLSRYTGTDYYSAILDRAIFGLNRFDPGDVIKWRIEARNQQGIWGYFPSSVGWDTTTVLSYSHFRQGLRVFNLGRGLIRADVLNNDTIHIKNNKAIALKLATSRPQQLQIEGNALATALHILDGKSFPFGFITPPSLNVKNFQSIPDTASAYIKLFKWGDPSSTISFDAFAVTSINFLFNVAGVSHSLHPTQTTAKIELIKDWFFIFSNYYSMWFDDPEFTSLTSIGEKVWFISRKFAHEIITNQTLQTQIMNFFINHLGTELGIRLALRVFTFASVVGNVSTFNNAMSAAFAAIDFITSPNADSILATKKVGHNVRLSLDQLPGTSNLNPILTGSAQTFSVKVTNLSNYQTHYNLWIGLDIMHYSPDSGKVENTRTSFVDSGGTNQIGRIEFLNQGIVRLRPNDSVTFVSAPYVFTTSVTGHNYRSSRYPYFYISRVWTNGQPGQRFPVQATSLNEHVVRKPFFIADLVAPHAPINLHILFETDSTAQLYWGLHPSDTLDLDRYIIYAGSDSNNVVPVDTVDASGNNGTVQINKISYSRWIRVKLVDIGGLTGPFSRAIMVGPITGVIEFGQHASVPKTYNLYSNFPNPFNSYTIITFDLPKNSAVTLEIYDLIGRKVRDLISQNKEAGTYAVMWNSRNHSGYEVASGEYFYRLTAIPLDGSSPFMQTRRMILLK